MNLNNTLLQNRTLIYHIDGSASAPSSTFGTDSDTGMYLIGPDIIGFATSGTERLRISADGAVVSQAPQETDNNLAVLGSIYANSIDAVSSLTGRYVGASGKANLTNTDLFGPTRINQTLQVTDNVGIGAAPSSSRLIVSDTVGVSVIPVLSVIHPALTNQYRQGLAVGQGSASSNMNVSIWVDQVAKTGYIQSVTFGDNYQPLSLQSLGALIQYGTTATITASTTQTQGQGALTSIVNQVSVCANNFDTVTLPSTAAGAGAGTGAVCYVINDGAKTLQIFPASGWNLGSGANNPTFLPSGMRAIFVAYSTTVWRMIV